MTKNEFSLLDKIIINVDQGLRAIAGVRLTSERENPAKNTNENHLSAAEKSHVIGLMRVNHSGEVCAQALYQGQAITARAKELQQKLQQAASEENDHLHWCCERIGELDGHVSYLNPLWYLGSFSFGIIAGFAGDQWNLGFLAETEHQVVKHIDKHLSQLPQQEHKSREILLQMREDEAKHATTAIDNGAAELPAIVKNIMQLTSKIMTILAYKI